MVRQIEAYKNNPTLFSANLTEDAKAVFEQIRTINLDQSRTFKADCLDMNNIFDKTTDAVKAQIPYLKRHDCEKNALERILLQEQQGN
jgi:hypothetical protein